MLNKVCYKCQETKPIECFYHNQNNVDGFCIYCKDCWREMARGYRHKSPDKYNEYRNRQYRKPRGRYKALLARVKREGRTLQFSCEEFCDWYNSQEKVCHYCGQQLIEWSKDLNGLTIDNVNNENYYSLSNMEVACRRCNTAKGNWFNEKEMLQIAGLYFGGKNDEILIKDPSQSLPDNPFVGLVKGHDERLYAHWGCQQTMLKENWVKVIPQEGK